VSAEVDACVVCGGTLQPATVKDGFELVSCAACGLLMRRRLPVREELDEIYGPEYFTHRADQPVDGYADYVGDADWHRATARRRLALLDRFAPSRGRLLDVGAAAGFFVDEANRAGWIAEGIDVAAHVVEWGRRELGVPIRVCGLGDVEGTETYAAVTMWDYIEHSLDPAGELARANELLRPGGLVALSTGDLDSLAARISRSRWHLLTPRHHNFFFSAATLTLLLERSGLEVAWVGHPGARYSLAHIAYKLDRSVRVGASGAVSRRVARSRLGGYSLPLNLYDIVTVVARKRPS
jgi:hypothetical protein